jgi:dipeptidyl aminopeptidase/acylaminoacyl peptidase
MTARSDLDRAMLDYFEGRSTNHAPDGLLETALAGVGATRQRPAWRTGDWWLPSAWADRVTWHTRRVALVAAVGLLIAILLALAILGGSGHPLPPPFGPAKPGAIVMDIGGDIYLAGPDGENRSLLYAGPHWDGHATFSPDGTKIAFESGQDDMSKALMVMRADGTGQTTLISRLAEADDVIAWSADSRWIATAARPIPDPGAPMSPYTESRIIVGDVEHGTASIVGGSDLFGHDPRWSPDGTMLAFGRCCSKGPDGLWLMRPDGSDLHPLALVQGGGAPAWSPDGKRIAFLGAGVDGDSDLYLIGADGSDQSEVTDDTGNESPPVWSPDGTKVGFSRMLDTGNKGELKILDVTTGRVTTLTGANVTHDPPVCSPDGAHILAYVFTRPDNPEHVSGYDTLGIFDVTNGSMPVRIPVAGLRFASWQRLAP